MTEPAELIEGSVQVKVGRREYWFAPLNLKGVKRMQAIQASPAPDGSPEQLDQGVEILLMSIRRNHPEVTADELEEEIDTFNVNRLVLTVLEVATAGLPKPPAATPASP